MAQQNKVTLKSYFQTGFKPTQQNFADLIDSFPNRDDDGINSDGSKNIALVQGLTFGNSSLETPGTIRWNGTTFQFRDNTSWKDFGAGGGASQWTSVGGDINLLTGNVGVGLPAATAPTYKFEVNIGSGTTSADQIRLGNAAIFTQANNAYFSHRLQASATNFALAQDTAGNTVINCASNRRVMFSDANTTRMALFNGVLCIGAISPSGPAALLFVNGEATKATASTAWQVVSDERIKKDISPFTDGLALLKKLNPVNFRYNGKAGIADKKDNIGLVAQEVREIFPYMVGNFKGKLEPNDEHETDLLSLDVSPLNFIVVNAIKELDARLAKLEKTKIKQPLN
jgi:hypothetical protein